MKKKETYVPQFDFSEEKELRKIQRCQSCGKETVSLHKGLCFECRQKDDSTDNVHDYNFGLAKYVRRCEEESKLWYKKHRFFGGLLLQPFAKYDKCFVWFLISEFFLALLIVALFESDFGAAAFSASCFLALVTAGIFSIKNKKRNRIKTYNEYCEIHIEFAEGYGWTCPCCERVNYKKYFCDECGVLPQLEKTEL